jgi:hypothetical protein
LKSERYVQQNTDNDGGIALALAMFVAWAGHTYTLSVTSKQPAWEIAQDAHHSHEQQQRCRAQLLGSLPLAVDP